VLIAIVVSPAIVMNACTTAIASEVASDWTWNASSGLIAGVAGLGLVLISTSRSRNDPMRWLGAVMVGLGAVLTQLTVGVLWDPENWPSAEMRRTVLGTLAVVWFMLIGVAVLGFFSERGDEQAG